MKLTSLSIERPPSYGAKMPEAFTEAKAETLLIENNGELL